MNGQRITSLVVDHLAQLLAQVLRFDGPADAVMSRYFKQHAKLGSRDRGLIAEAVFFALRRYATLRWMMQPAPPPRAPRLAALVTLARQHGAAALDARALRGDDRAVRHALSLRLEDAPPAVVAEVPTWLFQRIGAQYTDAAAVLAAMTEAAPLDLRVNTQRASRDEVLAELRSATRLHPPLNAEPTPYSPEGIRLREKPGLTRWPLYQEGRIEVQDESGRPLPGLGLADMLPLYGDELDAVVRWKAGAAFSSGQFPRTEAKAIAAASLSGPAPALKSLGPI